MHTFPAAASVNGAADNSRIICSSECSGLMDASRVPSSYIKLSLLSNPSEWLPTRRLPAVSLSATSPSLSPAPAADTASVPSPTSPHLAPPSPSPEKNVHPHPASSQQPLGHGTIKRKTRQELRGAVVLSLIWDLAGSAAELRGCGGAGWDRRGGIGTGAQRK